MYFDFSVPIPKITGKIFLTKRKNGQCYVQFLTGRQYKKEARYTVNTKVIIGKRCDDDPTQMFPNERYFEFFPDTPIPEERPASKRSSCLSVGAYIAIKKVIAEYQLDTMMRRHFGDDAGLLLDLATYMIVCEDNAGQHYPDYAYRHPLFTNDMRLYSDSKISRLFQQVTKDKILEFLDDWNTGRDRRQRIYVSYDSTNKQCQAGDIDIVEPGAAKEKAKKGLPIFNLGVAYDKTNQIPLFYEQYPGSITDISQFKCFVDKVLAYGYRHLGFVLDRGYFSQENIEYMDQKRFQFVLMVKGCKSLVSSFIESRRGTFEDNRECVIGLHRAYGTTIQAPLYSGDRMRFFHLYFSPMKMAGEREKLEADIEKMALLLKQSEGTSMTFAAPYTTYFDLHYDKDGTFLFAREKNDAITRALRLCGYFCIVTSEKMTAQDAYMLYKGRDASEKLFAADKTFLGSKSERVHSNEATATKIFVEFVGLIIRNRIYNLLKNQMLRLKVKKNYLTVPTAIKQLEMIELVRRNKELYRLDHAITKNQRLILQAFGISEDEVKREVATITKALSGAAQDAAVNQQEEDEEDGEDDCFTGCED